MTDVLGVAFGVAQVLESLGVAYTVGGSLASSFAGEPRSTVDIDFVVALTPDALDAFVAVLAPDFYVDDASLRRAITQHGTANLIHQRTQLKVDLFIAGGTPLDAQQLQRRRAVDLGDGRRLYVHPPEDILLQKLRWYRAGGEVSDRQWRDILGIIRAQGARLDRAYLVEHAPTIGVTDLLARAFEV